MPNTTPQDPKTPRNSAELLKALKKLVNESKLDSAAFDKKMDKMSASLDAKADKLESNIAKMETESDAIEEKAAEKLDANSAKFVDKMNKLDSE